MDNKSNSESFENFCKEYAEQQQILAQENVEDWNKRRQTLKHELDEAEHELKHWENVRDFYAKAKEAEE